MERLKPFPRPLKLVKQFPNELWLETVIQTWHWHLTLQIPHVASSPAVNSHSPTVIKPDTEKLHSMVYPWWQVLVTLWALRLLGCEVGPVPLWTQLWWQPRPGEWAIHGTEREAVKVFLTRLTWYLIMQMTFKREWEQKEQRLIVTEQRIATVMRVVKPLQAPQSCGSLRHHPAS